MTRNASQGIVLGIRRIVDHGLNEVSREWEIQVAWQGLQDEENSWEPFDIIKTDVPVLVRQYVEDKAVVELEPLL